MSTTKSKILAIFLMSLFFQKIGPSLFLKTYISEHIYKEQHVSSANASHGKVCAQNLLCSGSRIYEECHNVMVQPLVILPAKEIRYIAIHFPYNGGSLAIGSFLKQSALRGPPYAA